MGPGRVPASPRAFSTSTWKGAPYQRNLHGEFGPLFVCPGVGLHSNCQVPNVQVHEIVQEIPEAGCIARGVELGAAVAASRGCGSSHGVRKAFSMMWHESRA